MATLPEQNQSRIAELEALVAELQATVTELQSLLSLQIRTALCDVAHNIHTSTELILLKAWKEGVM